MTGTTIMIDSMLVKHPKSPIRKVTKDMVTFLPPGLLNYLNFEAGCKPL